MKRVKILGNEMKALEMDEIPENDTQMIVDQRFRFTDIFIIISFGFLFATLIAVCYIEPNAFYRKDFVFRNEITNIQNFDFSKVHPINGYWKVEGLQANNETIELYLTLPLLSNRSNDVAFNCYTRFYYKEEPLLLKRTRVKRVITTPSTNVLQEINYTFHIWSFSSFKFTSFEFEFNTLNNTNITNAYVLYRSKNVRVSSWVHYISFWVTTIHFCIVSYNHFKGSRILYEQKLVYFLEILIIVYNNPFYMFNYFYPSLMLDSISKLLSKLFFTCLLIYEFYSFTSCFDVIISQFVHYVMIVYFIYTFYWNYRHKNAVIPNNIISLLKVIPRGYYAYVQLFAIGFFLVYVLFLVSFAPFSSLHRFVNYFIVKILYIAGYLAFCYVQEEYISPDSTINLIFIYSLINTYGFHMVYLHSAYDPEPNESYQKIGENDENNSLELLDDEIEEEKISVV